MTNETTQENEEELQTVEQEEAEQIEVENQVSIQEKPSRFEKLKEWKNRIQSFIIECKRVLIVTKKPDREEFKTIVKISGLGILVIGLVGFVIHLFKELLF